MAVDIRDIALGSGIVSLALAAVTFLSTALVKHFLNQDFERYKQGLKSQHDKDLAAYKQQLATQHDKDLEQYKDRLKSESEQALTKYKAELDRNNAIDIERARVLLAEGQAEKDARRDYEYEARKRLYQECQPLLFQLIEVSENAFFQIQSLAKDVARKYLTKSLERFFQAPIWEGSKEKVTALVEALQSGLSH